jgi:hypothetical protein
MYPIHRQIVGKGTEGALVSMRAFFASIRRWWRLAGPAWMSFDVIGISGRMGYFLLLFRWVNWVA